MNDERIVEEIITKFLLNTCRLCPQLSRPAAEAVLRCVIRASEIPEDDEETDFIPLTTGSVAEFYIEPMLPHVSDVDVMYYNNSSLAIPRGYPPPTQLPAEFHNYVKVYEMIDSHLPGYVYMKLRYLLKDCGDDGMYNAVKYYEQMCFSFIRWSADEKYIHGPAMRRIIRPTIIKRFCVLQTLSSVAATSR